jgi:glc operon protein GlcG
LRLKPALTLEDAKKLMVAAEDEAGRNNWPVVTAILNDGGRMVAVHRMDGAQPRHDEIAVAKARCLRRRPEGDPKGVCLAAGDLSGSG